MTEYAKDAIGNCTCDTCPYYHQVQKGPLGVCIYDPPTPFVMGMVAAGGPLVDPTKPHQQAQPIIHGYHPVVGGKDGCGRHPERAQNRFNPASLWPPTEGRA